MTGTTPSLVYRDFVVDGVPTSGPNSPSKSDVRALLGSSLVSTPQWYGAVGDGVADDSVAIQAAIDSLASTGGVVYFPKATRYLFATALTVPGSVYLVGDGKYASILRYSGTGVAISPSSTDVKTIGVADLTIDVTGNNAVCLDAARIISGSFRSVRFRSPSGTGQVGVRANITNTGWTSFYNVFEDCTFDGAFTDAVNITSSVAQYANRWRFVAPTFLGCADCFDVAKVQGIQIVAPNASEHTSVMFRLGAGVVRPQISLAEMESSSGGTMWAVNAACNRLEVHGWKIHAGTDGSGSGMGLRAMWFADWDTGLKFSGSVTPTAISTINCADDVGMILGGTQAVTMTAISSASAPNNSIFKNSSDGKLYFKDNGGSSTALY